MNREPKMECPRCKQITFEHTDTRYFIATRTLEFTCSNCGELGYFDEHPKRDTSSPKDDCDRPRQVVAVVAPRRDFINPHSKSARDLW